MSRLLLVLGLVVGAPLALRADEEERVIPEFILLSTMAESDADKPKDATPAEKEATAQPVPQPAAPCQPNCAPCEKKCDKKSGGGFSKLLRWLTYREPGCSSCRNSCQGYPCCTPPLYTFFLHRCAAGCSHGNCGSTVQYHQTSCCHQK